MMNGIYIPYTKRENDIFKMSIYKIEKLPNLPEKYSFNLPSTEKFPSMIITNNKRYLISYCRYVDK